MPASGTSLSWYWYTDMSYANAPSPYPLAGDAPMEDFIAKVAGVRYVIDPGTRQERNYRFAAQDVLELRTFDPVASTAPALPVAILWSAPAPTSKPPERPPGRRRAFS